MGLDGFSMGNLGITTGISPAQLADQAEHLARKEAEIKVKDLEQPDKDGGVKRKSEEEEENNFHDGFQKSNDEETEEDENKKTIITEKDIESGDPKEFAIRINRETEMVELFSNKNGRVLETIKAEELMHLMSKLDNASGVIVNRKI